MEYEVFQMDAATWSIENKGVRFLCWQAAAGRR